MCAAYNPNGHEHDNNYWAAAAEANEHGHQHRWAQHTADNGVPYWENLDTGAFAWQMPDEVQAMGAMQLQQPVHNMHMPGMYHDQNGDIDDRDVLEYVLRLSLAELYMHNPTAAAAAAGAAPTHTPTPGPSQVREGRERNIFARLHAEKHTPAKPRADVPPPRAPGMDPGPASAAGGVCAMCSSSSAEDGVQRAPCGCTYCAECIVRMFMYATKREPYKPLRCCRVEFPMELAGTAFARVDAARTAGGPAAPVMSAGAGAGAQGNSNNATAAAHTTTDKGKGKDKGKGNGRDRDRENRRDKGKSRERAIPPQQQQRRVYSCAACLETFPLNDVMVVPGCHHSYCVPCMQRLFNESARSEDLFPPRCCRQPIPIVWANLILSTEEQDFFYKRKEEWKTPGHVRLYCARPACAAFIPPLRVFAAAGYGACEKCPARTCVHCKGAFHGGEACPRDKETQDVLSLAQTEGWKKCYSCNMMVELNQGCNHITCRCGAEFCYTCGTKWKGCNCQIWLTENLNRAVAAGEIPHAAHGVAGIPLPPAGPAIPVHMPAGAIPIRVMVPMAAVRMLPAYAGAGGGGGAPAGMGMEVPVPAMPPRIFVNHGGHIRELHPQPHVRRINEVPVQGGVMPPPPPQVLYNGLDGPRMVWDALNGRWHEF